MGSSESSTASTTKPNESVPEPESCILSTPDCATSSAASKEADFSKKVSGISVRVASISCTVESLTVGRHDKVIHIRVMENDTLSTYDNLTGSGKWFSVVVADVTGDIRVLGFNQMCDKFRHFFRQGHYLAISRFNCVPVKPQFKTTSASVEIRLSQNTVVEENIENVSEIPISPVVYENLKSLVDKPSGECVNVCGVLVHVFDIESFLRKLDGKTGQRRIVRLIDETETIIDLTIWEQNCHLFDRDDHPVVYLRRARTRV